MGVLRSGRKTEADGEFSIDRGAMTSQPYSEVTIAVFDENGDPADPDMTTGVVSGSVLKTGSGKRQDFTETVDLATDDWSWNAEISAVRLFYFSIAGLNANYTYEITITSWES